jgi:hypothetical protein
LSVVDVSLPTESVSQLPFKSETPDQHFRIQQRIDFPRSHKS